MEKEVKREEWKERLLGSGLGKWREILVYFLEEV